MTSVIIPVALLVSFLSFCHTVFLFAYLSLGVAIKGATSFSWQGKSQVAGECYHRGGRLSKLSLRYSSSTNIRTCTSLLSTYGILPLRTFSRIMRLGPFGLKGFSSRAPRTPWNPFTKVFCCQHQADNHCSYHHSSNIRIKRPRKNLQHYQS